MADTPTWYAGPIPISVAQTANLPTFGRIGIQGDKPHDPAAVTTGSDNAVSARK
ncbi:MAG TPA: hypothetical protein VGM37_10425 [Armatimonadota bacterium]|jgi:hypothetical protein